MFYQTLKELSVACEFFLNCVNLVLGLENFILKPWNPLRKNWFISAILRKALCLLKICSDRILESGWRHASSPHGRLWLDKNRYSESLGEKMRKVWESELGWVFKENLQIRLLKRRKWIEWFPDNWWYLVAWLSRS